MNAYEMSCEDVIVTQRYTDYYLTNEDWPVTVYLPKDIHRPGDIFTISMIDHSSNLFHLETDLDVKVLFGHNGKIVKGRRWSSLTLICRYENKYITYIFREFDSY